MYPAAAADDEKVVACIQQAEAEGRWFIAKDMNCDGVFTISDTQQWAWWLFLYPGDYILWMVMQIPELATFWELSPDAFGGWISGFLSGVSWFIALGILRGILKG